MSQQNIKHLAQQQFGQNPQGYVDSPSHAKGAELARLIELIQPQASWSILDVATGGGHTARTFAPHVRRVIASDLTAKMLIAARGHMNEQGITNVWFQQTDAEALPFADDSLDLVTCRIAPHHFPDVPHFVQEATRVTRSNGFVAVVDNLVPESREAARYVNAFERLRDPSHAQAHPLTAWIEFFETAGLSVQHTESFARLHSLVPWAKRMHCSPDVIMRLRAMLAQAPGEVAAWFDAQNLSSGDPSFLVHQATILGTKAT